jgi:RHS repeat-associated protein
MLLATDSRHSVLGELTPAGLNRLAYTPYGFQSVQRPVGSSLGFNGERREALTGCYHLGNGHRLYNPVLMRFYSPDKLSPFGKGGLNPYAYCVGDPVNFTDPTGEVPEWLLPVVLIAVNVATIAATLVSFLTPATVPVGAALGAARMSLVASPISIVGSGLQLRGVEEGKGLSIAGGIVSLTAVGTRIIIGINNWLSGPAPLRQAIEGFRHLVGLKPKLITGLPVRGSMVKGFQAAPHPANAPSGLVSGSLSAQTASVSEKSVWVRNGAVHYLDLDDVPTTFRFWV